MWHDVFGNITGKGEHEMTGKGITSVLLFVFLMPGVSAAVDKDDFKVDTTKDLILLCQAPENDPLHEEAVHFCIGFLVGAYHYHAVSTSGEEGKPLVCLPDPAPPRGQVITQFVDWANDHPEYMAEEPVDTWFRFLIETYPCEQ